MNYEISRIANFEKCNAGIPRNLIQEAAANVIRENWQHDIDLAEAVTNAKLDLAAETQAVNDALSEAGCETRAEESDIKAGLDRWIELETIRGNL